VPSSVTQSPPDAQSAGLVHGSPNAAMPPGPVHSLGSHANPLPQLPLTGPLAVLDTHWLDAPHHPQPPTGVHVLQVVCVLHGSVVEPAHARGSHTQPEHEPLLGPPALPELQRVVPGHHPQPAFGVQPAHDE